LLTAGNVAENNVFMSRSIRERKRESHRQKVSRYMACKSDIPYSITQDVLLVFNIRSLLYTVLHIIHKCLKKKMGVYVL